MRFWPKLTALVIVVVIAVGAWQYKRGGSEALCKERMASAFAHGETLANRPAECARLSDKVVIRLANEVINEHVATP